MATKQRRARGTGFGRVAFYVEVDPDVKTTIDGLSDTLGVPKWRVVEELVRYARLSPDERPAWWPEDAQEDQEELPLRNIA